MIENVNSSWKREIHGTTHTWKHKIHIISKPILFPSKKITYFSISKMRKPSPRVNARFDARGGCDIRPIFVSNSPVYLENEAEENSRKF